MSRLDEIEARVDLLEWGDEHQQASVIDAIPADLRALLAVARAAEALYPIIPQLFEQLEGVDGLPFSEYETLAKALDALDAKEGDGETTNTTD